MGQEQPEVWPSSPRNGDDTISVPTKWAKVKIMKVWIYLERAEAGQGRQMSVGVRYPKQAEIPRLPESRSTLCLL